MMYACVYEQNGVGLEQFFALSYSLARPEIIFELRHWSSEQYVAQILTLWLEYGMRLARMLHPMATNLPSGRRATSHLTQGRSCYSGMYPRTASVA